MKISRMFFLSLFVFLVACSQQPFSVQTLPNGKEVKIIGVTKAYFTEGDTALILAYETDLSLEDKGELLREAKEIWPTFRVNVEQYGLNAAAIQATKTTKTSPFTSTAKQYTFVYTKNSSGQWELGDNP